MIVIDKLLPDNQPKLDEDFVQLASSILDTDYTMLDILPMSAKKDILPHLAVMFGVDITGLDEKATRIYIQNALEIHRYKGTVYAVKKAIDAMFDDAVLYEWFDRDLAAGLFDVEVTVKADTSKVYSHDQFKKAKAMIDDAKNVRSHLNSFDIALPLMAGTIHKDNGANLSMQYDQNHIENQTALCNSVALAGASFEYAGSLPQIVNHTIEQEVIMQGGAMWML